MTTFSAVSLLTFLRGVTRIRLTGKAVTRNISPSVAFEAASVATLGASYLTRESNEDGPRVAVICPSLGGAFFFSVEEAERRIRRFFPGLQDDDVRGVTHLMAAQVRRRLAPNPKASSGWINRWVD